MDSLVLVCLILHGVACCVAIGYAHTHRRSAHQRDALLLAVVWSVWFVLDLARAYISTVLPAPSAEPYSGARNRVLLALDSAFYLAWPLGLAGWIRWVFIQAKPFVPIFAWVLAFGVPTIVYPAIRGENWFRLAGLVHVLAFGLELVAFVQWAKLRRKPLPVHGVAIATALLCLSPIFAFFASSGQRSDYPVWVLRALIVLHLGLISFLGGALCFTDKHRSNTLQ